MPLILKIIFSLFLWAIFIFIVLKIPYPDSLTQANFNQIVPFFVSLYFALSFTLNILLKNIFLSAAIILGLVFTLLLKALDSLNLVTAILTLLATGLLASYFRKVKKRNLNPIKSDLTKLPKIPGLKSTSV